MGRGLGRLFMILMEGVVRLIGALILLTIAAGLAG